MSSRRASPRNTSSETSWVPIVVLSLLAVGCAQDWSWQRKRRSIRFQVEEDSPLYEPAQRAAAAWSAAIGRSITVTPDGRYPIFISENPDCWDGVEGTSGCSYISSDPDNGYIALLPHVPVDKYYGVLLHEMGHHLRGLLEPQHLDDPNVLMTSGRTVEEITPADVEYACENFNCNLTEAS